MGARVDLADPLRGTPRRLSRRISRADLTLASWWRDVRSPRDHTTRGRFSIDKTRKLVAYTASTSRARHLAVLCLYPLPGLLVALALALIPLRDPHLGVRANGAYFVQIFCVGWLTMNNTMLLARAVTGIQHREYPTRAIALVAVLTSALMAGTVFVVGTAWRFPIPFSWAFASLPFVAFLILTHIVVFRGPHELSARTRTKLLLVTPSLALQVSQVTIYPAYSALFATASEWQQIALVVLFPGIKYALKRSILALSRHLGDFARESSSCGVEICASIYQATIMQGTPPMLVTAAVIGLDVLWNVVHVKRYMERRSIVPTEELISKALAILLDPTRPPIYDHELTRFATRVHSPIESTTPVRSNTITDAVSLRGSAPVAPSTAPTNRKLGDADRDKVIVVHALEILQSAEVILLDEYLEVMVPFANTCFLLVASQLPSAVFNPKLVDFYFDPSQLRAATLSILLYTLLQGLTFAGMYAVMRIRYRLSAFGLLAFVMENHKWSLQAKLTSWMVIILAFPVVHYGVDFTFTFEFTIRTN